MTTPKGDAEQIHELVEDINAGQVGADRQTTIVQPQETDS